MKERDLADTTAERYEGILRNYIEPHLGRRALFEIKEPAIWQWRKTLQDASVGAATIAKAYRMVHSMFNTAVEDLLIRRNPCRIERAGQDKAGERPTLTIEQVFAVADAIQPRYRLLVLLGALTSLRFGEFAALRRRDVDVEVGELRVRQSQAELKHGRTIIKDPKSEAGKRSVAIPDVVLADLRDHLDRFSEAEPDGLVFIGPKGGRLRRATSSGCKPGVDGRQGCGRRRALSRPPPHRQRACGGHGCGHQGTDGPHGALIHSSCADLPARQPES